MKRLGVSIVVILILLSSSFFPAAALPDRGTDGPSTKHTIYVDDDNTYGPWNGSYEYPYQTISDGIQQAANDDLVFVFNGIYHETLIINKSIDLCGEQQNTTIIDGLNTGSVVTIVSDSVDLRGVTLRNSGGYQDDAGIKIAAQGATITSCTIFRTRTGISLENVQRPLITNCRFHTNGYGIVSRSSTFVSLDHCTFYHNGIGAYFSETKNIRITNCYADTNSIGFLCEQSSTIHISESAACDNNDNEGGMFFQQCSGIDLFNCYLVHNGLGLNIVDSSEWYISRCTFSRNTHYACKIKNSALRSEVINCLFTQNFRYGMYVENSTFNASFNNIYENEDYGLYAKSSFIDATRNWWGSRFGPAHTGLPRADRIRWAFRDLSVVPWLKYPVTDVGPTWDLEGTFEKPSYSNPWPEQITFPDLDTDGDQVPDWWENKWGYDPTAWDDHQHLDPDKDSLNNIEECFMDHYDSNPFKRDVFLEFDWTESLIAGASNKPPVQEITQMIEAFARQNITLHVDTGELGGGEQIPASAHVSEADIISIYWDYFLHNDLNSPRPRIFHYGIICDYSEGAGFAVMGWDHLNSFVISAQILGERFPRYTREWVTMTSAMHEVGHTMGLIVTKFNGIDHYMTMKPIYKEFWVYSRYKSILNYLYTFSSMDFSDGSHGPGDYDDWGHLDFSFFKNTSFEYPV